jgi:short-subunit dehydrogenase involved in D-alanine esterification of teichoic acids
LNVSSVLGFVPMAFAALYSATKAGIHAYSMSLRYRLKGTSVAVQEIAPPWVQTDLLNSSEEASRHAPQALPRTDDGSARAPISNESPRGERESLSARTLASTKLPFSTR